jgi:hypothetical protein
VGERPAHLLRRALVEAVELPSGVQLSPAQAAWLLPLQAKYANDLRRDPSCEGCEAFGLCVLHSTDQPPARRRARSSRPRACSSCGVKLPKQRAKECASCRTLSLFTNENDEKQLELPSFSGLEVAELGEKSGGAPT